MQIAIKRDLTKGRLISEVDDEFGRFGRFVRIVEDGLADGLFLSTIPIIILFINYTN